MRSRSTYQNMVISELNSAIAFVKEKDDKAYSDYHARRLVDDPVFWQSLRAAGYQAPVAGYGSRLRSTMEHAI